MIPSVKKVIHKSLRLLLYPIHRQYSKRNGQETHVSRMELPNHILLGAVKDAIKEGHTATIVVKGWSMRPFLEHQRDKVLLDSPIDATLYDAVLAEIAPGKFVLHRIIGIKPNPENNELDEITLMGDGNIRGTENCLRKNLCGKVTQYIRPNRLIQASDPSLVKNVKRWNRLLPIRRYLLIIYKAII
jgi:hypothetical protein